MLYTFPFSYFTCPSHIWNILVPFPPKQSHFKYAPMLTLARTNPPNFQLNRNAPLKILNVLFIYVYTTLRGRSLFHTLARSLSLCMWMCVWNYTAHELLCARKHVYMWLLSSLDFGVSCSLYSLSSTLFIHSSQTKNALQLDTFLDSEKR